MNTQTIMETAELMEQIRISPAFIQEQLSEGRFSGQVPSLREFLTGLFTAHGKNTATVLKASLLSKSYFYQILSGTKRPGRDVLVRISLAADASLEETQRLLTLAQVGVLYPKVRRDAALLCCLRQKLSVTDASEFLTEIGERPLL